MDDRLLEDYLQELRWLRTASGEFARRHPHPDLGAWHCNA